MDGNIDELDDLIKLYKSPAKPKTEPNSDVSPLLDKMRDGLVSQESGGNRAARNQRTGALSLFQVLPENVRPWTRKHLQKELSPEEFVKNTEAQEQVFRGEMGEYLKAAKRKGVDDDTAIRMGAAGWYGGKGAMHRFDDPNRFRSNEPSFQEYTTSILKKINKGNGYRKPSFNSIDEIINAYSQEASASPPPPTSDTSIDDVVNAYSPNEDIRMGTDLKIGLPIPPAPPTTNPVTPARLPEQGAAAPIGPPPPPPVSPFTKQITLADTNKTVLTREDGEENSTAVKRRYSDDFGNSYQVGADGKIESEIQPSKDFALTDASGRSYVQHANQEGLKPNQIRVGASTTAIDGLTIAEKKTGKDGKVSYSILGQNGASGVTVVKRLQPKGRTAQAAQPVQTQTGQAVDPTAEQLAEAATAFPSDDVSQHQTAGERKSSPKNLDITVPVSPNKPIREAIDAATRNAVLSGGYGLTGADVDAAFALPHNSRLLLSDKSTATDTFLSEAAKTGSIRHTVGAEFIQDALAEQEKRINRNEVIRSNALSQIASGRDLSKEDIEALASKGVYLKDLPKSQIDEALSKGAESKQKFNDLIDKYKSNPETRLSASILANRDSGRISNEEADELLAFQNERLEQIRANEGSKVVPTYDDQSAAKFAVSTRARTTAEIEAATEERLNEILNENGSVKNLFLTERKAELEKAKLDREYISGGGYSVPLQVAKSYSRGAAQVVTDLVQAGMVLNEISETAVINLVYGKGNRSAPAAFTRPIYKAVQVIDDKIKQDLADDPRLKDGKLLTTIPETFGGLAVQMLAGFVTGGAVAPTLLGMGQGATGQYKEAVKGGANPEQRAAAAILGGGFASPDAVLFSKWFKGASILKQKTMLGSLSRSIYRKLQSSGIIASEAKVLTDAATKGFLLRMGEKGVQILKSGGFEVVQETSENHGNDLVAYLTYDKSPERLKKALTFGTKEDAETAIVSFLAGGGGEVLSQATQKQSPAQRELTAKNIGDLLSTGKVTPEQHDILTQIVEASKYRKSETDGQAVGSDVQANTETSIKSAQSDVQAPQPAQSTSFPVTERPVTLAAQEKAAESPTSVSVAVLYPRGENVPDVDTNKFFPVATSNGDTLIVNEAKAKKFFADNGLGTYGRGKATRLIGEGKIDEADLTGGYAKKFENTAGGSSLVTTDAEGNELGGAKISDNPIEGLTAEDLAVAEQQADLHTDRFGDVAVKSQIVPTDEVVASRTEDRPITEGIPVEGKRINRFDIEKRPIKPVEALPATAEKAEAKPVKDATPEKVEAKEPLSADAVKRIIKQSPVPDFDAYVKETINDFKNLVGNREEIAPQELANRIANGFDLDNKKTFLAYSALTHADKDLVIKGSWQGVNVRGRHKGNEKQVEISKDATPKKVEASAKEDFRLPLQHLLSTPNTPRVSNLLGAEKELKSTDNAISYTSGRTRDKGQQIPLTIKEYQSDNGTRYVAMDGDFITAAAFVDKNNELTGIINEEGYSRLGIGKSLYKFIQKVNPTVKPGGVASQQGQRLLERIAAENPDTAPAKDIPAEDLTVGKDERKTLANWRKEAANAPPETIKQPSNEEKKPTNTTLVENESVRDVLDKKENLNTSKKVETESAKANLWDYLSHKNTTADVKVGDWIHSTDDTKASASGDNYSYNLPKSELFEVVKENEKSFRVKEVKTGKVYNLQKESWKEYGKPARVQIFSKEKFLANAPEAAKELGLGEKTDAPLKHIENDSDRRDLLLESQPVHVDTQKVGQFEGVKQLREKAREIYNSFLGKTVQTTDGRRVGFTKTGIKETISHSADERVLYVVPELPELIKNAIPLWSEPSTKPNQPNIKAFHNYGIKTEINGEIGFVRISIREDNDGHLYYDNHFTSEDVIQKARLSQPDRNAITGEETTAPSKDRLVEWIKNVNEFDTDAPLKRVEGETRAFSLSTENPEITELSKDALYQKASNLPYTIDEDGIEVNQHHLEILRRLDNDPSEFGGIDYERPEALSVADDLEITAAGKSEDIQDFLFDLARDIRKIARRDGGASLFTPVRRHHEVGHRASSLGSGGKPLHERIDVEEGRKREEYKYARQRLLNLGYPNKPEIILEEMMRHIEEGRHADIDLTKKQAASYAKWWYNSFSGKGGDLSIKQFDRAAKFTKKELNNARNKALLRRESEPGTSGAPSQRTGNLQLRGARNQNKGLDSLPGGRRSGSGEVSGRAESQSGGTEGGEVSAERLAPNGYKINHRISRDEESTTTLDDMTKGGQLVPEDFYTHPHYYADLSDAAYKQSMRVIKEMRGKPDAEVTIYRGVPASANEINPGDWISLSPIYAKNEIFEEDGKVISKKVKASEVIWDGNDINEFAYYPLDTDAPLKQVAGEKGAANLTDAVQRLDNLQIAREMETVGKDAKTIWLATGWEKGGDGKWKTEIDEKAGQYDKSTHLTDEYYKAISPLVESPNKIKLKLDSVLHYPELFQAYPELKNVRVLFPEFITESQNANGAVNKDGSLSINRHLLYDEALSTILHEVQHKIQNIEGFAKGGNNEGFTVGQLYNFDKDVFKKDAKEVAYRAYRSLGGEVEARNVQTRMNMSAEERALKTLSETEDIDRASQIYLQNSIGEANSILKKVRSIEDSAALTKTLPVAPFHEVIDAGVTSSLNAAGDVELSPAASEILRRAIADNYFERKGVETDESVIAGGLLYGTNLTRLVKKLEQKHAEALKADYTTSELKGFKKLINDLNQSAKRNEGTSAVYVFDDALPEEKFHQEDVRLGRSDLETIEQLKKSPLWNTGAKFERDYPKIEDAGKVSEIAAKLDTNDAIHYGWHRTENFEAEKEKFLTTFATAIVNKNLNRIESIGIEAFRKEFERISNYANFEEINARTGDNVSSQATGNDGARQDNRRPGAENESGNQTDQNESGEQVRDSAQTKNRKYAETLAKNGFDVGDVKYNPQTVIGWQTRAAQTIEDLGVDGAIKEFDRMSYSNSEGNKTALGDAILSHLYADGDTAKLKDFGKRLVETVGNAAQELRAAQLISRYDPKFAPVYAEKLKTNAEGTKGIPLTDAESNEATELAEDVSRKSDEFGFTSAALDEHQEHIKTLEKEVSTLQKEVDALSTRPKRTQNETALRDKLTKALNSARYYKNLIENGKPTRTSKNPVKLSDLAKNIESRRDELMKKIRAGVETGAFLKQVAWHGSPHKFDKFSTEHLLKGEGANAYGAGLYFTDSEKVADYYKETLAKGNTIVNADGKEIVHSRSPLEDDRALNQAQTEFIYFKGDVGKAIEQVKKDSEENTYLSPRHYNEVINYLNNFADKGYKVIDDKGAKYKVDLKPEQADYLLWDKPLSEQSEKVQNALEKLIKNRDEHFPDSDTYDKDALKGKIKSAGRDVYEEIASLTDSEKQASDLLKSLGVRGIKYLDGDSRQQGEGSYNYVIFDDADVEITEILKKVERDTEAYDALVDLGTLHLIKELPNNLTPKQFDAFINNLADGNLTEPEIREIHARAFEALKSDNAGMSDEAKLRQKNRIEHAKLANPIINADRIASKKQTADALKANDAFRYDRYARTLAALAQDADQSEQAVFTAFGMRELGDVSELKKSLKENFPDITNKEIESAVIAGQMLNDKTKQSLARKLADKKAEQTLTDEEYKNLEKQMQLSRDADFRARRELNKYYAELVKPQWKKNIDKGLAIYNISRSLNYSGDMGFILRQGGVPMLTNTRAWLKAMTGIKQAFSSEETFTLFVDKIRNEAMTKILESRGVEFEEIGQKHSLNENFINAITQKLPFIKQSNLAHSLTTDLMRRNIGEQLFNYVNKLNMTDTEKARAEEFLMKKWVNIITGKGYMGNFVGSDSTAQKIMSTALGAPRFAISQFQFMYYTNPVRIALLPKGARAVVAKAAIRYYTPQVAIMAILSMLGLVSIDPEDKDFGVIRGSEAAELLGLPFLKDMHLDFLGGKKEPFRLTYGLGMKYIVYAALGNTDGMKRIQTAWSNEVFGSDDRFSPWLRGKLNPAAGVAYNAVTGEDMAGNPYSGWSAPLDLLAPIMVKNIIESATYSHENSVLRDDNALDWENWRGENAMRVLTTLVLEQIGVGAGSYPTSPSTVAMKEARTLSKFHGGENKTPEEEKTKDVVSGLKRLQREGIDITAKMEKYHKAGVLDDEDVKKIKADKGVIPILNLLKSAKPEDIEKVLKFANENENWLNNRAREAEIEKEALEKLLGKKAISKQAEQTRESIKADTNLQVEYLRGKDLREVQTALIEGKKNKTITKAQANEIAGRVKFGDDLYAIKSGSVKEAVEGFERGIAAGGDREKLIKALKEKYDRTKSDESKRAYQDAVKTYGVDLEKKLEPNAPRQLTSGQKRGFMYEDVDDLAKMTVDPGWAYGSKTDDIIETAGRRKSARLRALRQSPNVEDARDPEGAVYNRQLMENTNHAGSIIEIFENAYRDVQWELLPTLRDKAKKAVSTKTKREYEKTINAYLDKEGNARNLERKGVKVFW